MGLHQWGVMVGAMRIPPAVIRLTVYRWPQVPAQGRSAGQDRRNIAPKSGFDELFLEFSLWDFDARLHIDRYIYDLDSDKGACRLKFLVRRTARPKPGTDDNIFDISYVFQ